MNEHSTTQLHWRQAVPNPQLTMQEQQFAEWLSVKKIPFFYEQLRLIKDSSHKKKKVKNRLHKVPDFAFIYYTDNQANVEYFIIELTDRKRPAADRVRPLQADPKKETRHLARLAGLPCGVIYRNELSQFCQMYDQLWGDSARQSSPPDAPTPLLILKKTVEQWNLNEWEGINPRAKSIK
jgi:hypothetical protein